MGNAKVFLMKIYNSLTKRKEEFEPIGPGIVNIYTCGVTVYDDCHIGHARSLYIFDMMRRYLEYKGYKVNFVRNITDIDDKIINRANELKTGWRELVDKYIVSYREDLKGLGVCEGLLDKDGEEPRATKNIPDMIRYIAVLIDKGYAYEAGGDVYFDLRKFKEYGKLSGQNIDKMREGVRILPDEKKKDALDFALWKKSKENEPRWDSPWSKGRPGWHIECSVMSQKFLNVDTLDIHAGGRDLIFPHHENEIAQAEARTGKPFAKYWIHHGLLTIENQKMAKSMGNFITIKDALKRYPVDALKIFYLQAHYSSSIDFSEKKMEEAKQALNGLKIFIKRIEGLIERMNRPDWGEGPSQRQKRQGPKKSKEFMREIDKRKSRFIQSMDDDFNAAAALAAIFNIKALVTDNTSGPVLIESDCFDHALDTIIELTSIFGLSSIKREKAKISDYAELKIKERNIARKNKDFKKADTIREQLQKKGIAIEDTKRGTLWRKL